MASTTISDATHDSKPGQPGHRTEAGYDPDQAGLRPRLDDAKGVKLEFTRFQHNSRCGECRGCARVIAPVPHLLSQNPRVGTYCMPMTLRGHRRPLLGHRMIHNAAMLVHRLHGAAHGRVGLLVYGILGSSGVLVSAALR